MIKSKPILQVLKLILLAIILYFVYRELASRWGDLRQFAWDINVPLLIVSLAAHLLTFLLFSKVWSILMLDLGYRVRLRDAFRLSYITSLARYVPGKFWPIFGMTYLAKGLGIRESVAVASWILALVYTIPASFLVAMVLAAFAATDIGAVVFISDAMYWTVLLAVLVGSAALIFLPNLSIGVFNRLLRLFRKPTIDCSISRVTAAVVFVGHAICWTSYGFAFWLLTKAVVGDVAVSLVDCISGFILSYQIGYLAIFAPGGVGVRELVLAHVMELSMGSAAIGLAVICRVWNLAAELIAAAIALMVRPATHPDSGDTDRIA